ncbi:MAG: hypothetical protein ABS85_07685 [Sphingobacteriales bacterium SCN 48-20]|uniref:hypothetical protein n=1 Tax=Terrimonas ferruginea TaxID=249 RepID=UPI00086D0DCD|nr:hypothetical protein [Terrimonas ferruginea]MBN8782688.1 hypothetical protein [Terrimonas ferruginea]ODT92866.1 MAG: hypothetical protein ABS85_07685 [Sphingobacteriales bacterium SCN 48-20]OJW43895.1 MAG: hypothetical protein BGO56_18475 [Sphingobacteriales bacterium 48-107]
MSLNEIDLNAALLTELYGQVLVDTGERAPAKVTQSREPVSPPVAEPPTVADTISQPAVAPALTPEPVTSPVPGPAAPVIAAAPPTDDDWKFLGKNAQKVLIVVDYQSALHIPDEELGFLTQLLAACKLNLGDITLVNFLHYRQTSYQAVLEKFGSRRVILFGLDPVQWGLPINFPQFQQQAFAGCQFLHAPDLSAIKADKLVKTKLWVALQPFFGL